MLGCIYDILPWVQFVEDIKVLLDVLSRHCDHISEWMLRKYAYHPTLICATCLVTRQYIRRGRPSYEIRREDLEALLELGFNYRQVGEILGVSEITIRHWRTAFGLPVGANSYSTISNSDLDCNVLEVGTCIIIIHLANRQQLY